MTLTANAATHTGPAVAQPQVPNDGPGLDPAQNPPVAAVHARAGNPVTGPTRSLASRVTPCDSIPWTPFPMPGTAFKLLNINETTGATSILLYVSEGAQAPLHLHVGAAEAYNIFGNWAYEGEAEPIGPNCYVYEPAGIVHLPKQENEALMFGIFHGPIVGFHDDGTVAGIITADLLWDLAEANGAVAHLPARAGR
ncbi:cupin domain-containing protein [Nocardia farcinica]|uniref:cupin domain-containing protein n=1 Tax=Nocardia farcinica TaxID=37329 RepID=UPI0024554535|nr:cupin domain-containing protein [Nocardia farcinica]